MWSTESVIASAIASERHREGGGSWEVARESPGHYEETIGICPEASGAGVVHAQGHACEGPCTTRTAYQQLVDVVRFLCCCKVEGDEDGRGRGGGG